MGGGAPEAVTRNIPDEQAQIKQLNLGQEQQYKQFTKKDPILSGLYGQVAGWGDNWGALSQEEQLATKRAADEYAQAHVSFFNPSTVATEALTSDIYSNQKQAQRMGLASGVLTTGTQAYGALTNPILNYASDVIGFNANAENASKIAAANKGSSTSSGIMSTIGTVAGAAATAY
jgi:hypothetical protein